MIPLIFFRAVSRFCLTDKQELKLPLFAVYKRQTPLLEGLDLIVITHHLPFPPAAEKPPHFQGLSKPRRTGVVSKSVFGFD